MNDYHPMATAQEDLQEVEQEIARFSARPLIKLPYPPAMEARFEQETSGQRRQHLTLYGLIALLIYDLFLVGDYFMYPEHFAVAMAVRLGIVTPLVLVMAWLLQQPLRPMWRESGATLLCVSGCVSILWLHGHADLAAIVQAEPSVFIVLFCMSIVLRVDFIYAAAGTLACLAAEFFFLSGTNMLTFGNRLTITGRVCSMAALSLLMNYILSREQRMAWLQRLHSRIQGRLLTEANAELLNLSATDHLTGLSNRYGYEVRIAQLWRSCQIARKPLSAIMVDVDHFKNLNDSFGHPYGDRVLSRVATLLVQAMRAEEDFVARIGGEEFIVLLPDSDEAAVVRVAERIRLLVQVAGSPAVRGDTVLTGNERWSTVSCGTATVIPSASTNPLHLMEAADAALYRAKQTGRNRVCSSPPLGEPAEEAPRRMAIVPRAS